MAYVAVHFGRKNRPFETSYARFIAFGLSWVFAVIAFAFAGASLTSHSLHAAVEQNRVAFASAFAGGDASSCARRRLGS